MCSAGGPGPDTESARAARRMTDVLLQMVEKRFGAIPLRDTVTAANV